MPRFADRAIAALLVVVHAGLLAWALVGFAELAWPLPPWPRLSNPLFSGAMLLLQWTVVAAAAVTYLAGYASRWAGLRRAMVGWYVVMAAICAWQTFFILEHSARFAQMALEYFEYAVITLYLYRSQHIRERLSVGA